jgi:hypothetical protein
MRLFFSLSILITLTFCFSGVAIAETDWDSSPYNGKNSPYTWENSSHNGKNSPHNRDNSPYKWDNDRIIRDNQGRTKGYAAPKSGGGVNYFDFDGNRRGYNPGQD